MKTLRPLVIAILMLTAGTAATLPDATAASPNLLYPPANRIVGTWEYFDVHVFNCASGQTVTRFRASSVYHVGGTMVDTNTTPPGTRGPAFGIWDYNPRTREYTTHMRLYRYNPDGSFAGANEVVRTATLSRDGNSMSETFRGKFFNPAEQLLFESCGSSEGVRSL
ncbi:hypothetical protein E4582_06015 [Luteimonas yindakuii]|uniref:Uncharacterized protein n=1 Tax=Luteimonas yindakuii TaxID=2565782 RepID=A0A4Z1RI28_9GAMM|nr:hypothetical protein [Luteimonas yindakuii]QCO68019.1 hypothetical protein E5843_10065 [Luteimonas yindakuii]TKS54367.1 hypothetical protein E4582_06015 [Luteimonas yindakuii]